MGHLIAVIVAAFCFAPQDQGDVVRVSLRGGLEVEGALLSVDSSAYRLRVAGDVRTLDARDVLSVTVLALARPPAPAAGAPPAAMDRIRTLVEKNDYDRAVKEIDELLKLLGGQRSDVEALLRKSLGRTMDSHLAAQRAADALEAFRRATQWLADVDVADAFARLTAAAEAEAFERPATAFARDLTLAVAREVSKNAKLGEGYRRRALWLVTNLADRQRDLRAFLAEADLIAAAADLFPEARDSTADRRARARLDYAESALTEGRFGDALHETGQVLAASPANIRAREIFDRSRFQQVLASYPRLDFEEALSMLRAALAENPTPERAGVLRLREAEVISERLATASRAEAIDILSSYLGQDLPADLLEWGREEFAKLERPTPGGGQDIEVCVDVSESGPHPDVARYFPFGKGARYAYRRRDGTQITVTHDAVVREGSAYKIDYSLEEKSGDDRQRHAFQQFVGPTEVYTETRGHNEVLLRFPAREGDTWTWSIGDATYTRRVTSTKAIDRVDAKEYADCLQIEFTTTIPTAAQTITVTSRSTYAPGVGLVRMEFVEPAYQKFSLELVSYVEATK